MSVQILNRKYDINLQKLSFFINQFSTLADSIGNLINSQQLYSSILIKQKS
jgi:hypothetical protein